MQTPAHICILRQPNNKVYWLHCEVAAVHLPVQTAYWSTVEQAGDDALCPDHWGISVRMSQAVHHGQKVVSFAAGTGRWIPRLCELPHDLGQLCIGLLVLEDNVIHQSQWSSQGLTPRYSQSC